ncbi:MAG: hypothetical protein WKF96_03955 [Solirubrobacteraceae bacterium]
MANVKAVRLQLLGAGDAFGNGGRFQTCFWLSPDPPIRDRGSYLSVRAAFLNGTPGSLAGVDFRQSWSPVRAVVDCQEIADPVTVRPSTEEMAVDFHDEPDNLGHWMANELDSWPMPHRVRMQA